MKILKPSRKWKPELGGKTTGDSRILFLYGILGYIGVTIVLFFPVWIGKFALFANDIVNLNLPQRHLLGEIWRTGEVPLWNPYSFAGQPLLAAMQAGVLYPLHALFLFLPDYVALTLSYILHYSLAGIFLYFYLYALKRDHLSAWLAGVIFMCSGFLMGHLIHTQMLDSAVWVPLVLYFLEKLRQTGRTRYAFGVTFTLTVQWLAGHPQISFYTYMLAGLYLLFFAWQERAAWKRTILQGVLALLAGGLLASVQLIPTFDLIRHSVREAATYEFFISGAMTNDWLGGLFVPFYHGGGYTGTPFREETLFWEYAGYAGVLTIAVAAAAFGKGWRRPHVLFFALLTGLGLILCVGDKTPLFRLLYHIPVMNMFRFPSRYIFFVDLGCAVLTGLMLKELLTSWTGRVLLLAGMLLPGAAIWWIRTWWQPVSQFAWQMPVFVLMAGIAVLFIFWKNGRLLPIVFAAVMAADSLVYATSLGAYTWRPVEKAASVPAAVQFLHEQPGRFRVAAFEFGLGLDRAARYDVEAINGYDSLVAKQYAEHVDLGWSWGVLDRPRETLDLLNVKYVTANKNDQKLRNSGLFNGAGALKPVWQDDTTVIYLNPTAYPRYWLASSEGDYRSRRADKVEETSFGYSRETLSYKANSAGVLVVSQMFDPGWKAEIDGKQAVVKEIGGYLTGIDVPSGTHTVTFHYQPSAWLWGRIVSGVALLLMGFWAFISARKLMW